MGSLVALLLSTAIVTDTNDREAAELFERRVRPLLVERCSRCHGEKKQASGLRVDSRAALFEGGDSGPAIRPDEPGASLLVQAVRREGDLRMPPRGKREKPLRPDEVDAIERWVRAGAPWPAGAAESTQSGDDWRSHWAFQPITNPTLPKLDDAASVHDPIDRFIRAKLTEQNLTPSPAADRRTWLRRVTFDVTGLPPTQDELDAFLDDDSAAAFEKVVDRLLASPRHGERWGRHWLDVARYSDTKGYVFFEDREFPFAYTYRDYVVRAFATDKPYDEFIVEQIAADRALESLNDPDVAGLGFLTVGQRFMNNPHDILDDRIDVVTRGLLGLTVSCARCHDHKYDPIPTADYYSLYGVFSASAEPSPLPAIAPPATDAGYRKFDAELQKRVAALQGFVDAKYRGVVDGARKRSAEYLLAAHEAMGKPTTDNFMLLTPAGALNPLMTLRWKNYLLRTARTRMPAFVPWHALASVPAEEMRGAAERLIGEWTKADGISTVRVNRIVVSAIAEKLPSSLGELAAIYSNAFLAAKESGSEDERELWEVLHGRDSPPMLDRPERFDFSVLQLLPDRPAQGEFRKFQNAVAQWQSGGAGAVPRAMALVDVSARSNPRVFRRGNPNLLGKEVPRRFLGLFTRGDRRSFDKGSGRLELARAIVSRENPLTARVIVNRVWMHHFGEPLVETPGDFGVRSSPPSHPSLLDHLATRLVAEGWSLKRLHRRMLLSSTYRQSSVDRAEVSEVDPGNRWLWRMPRRRLEIESLRDSMLAISGSLDERVGGKSVGLLDAGGRGRRTVYSRIDRADVPKVLRTFDFPSAETTSPRRSRTTVAPQALFLMNHPFALACAKQVLSLPELKSAKDVDSKLRVLYSRLFQRAPTAREITIARRFVGEIGDSKREPADDWSYGYRSWDAKAKRLGEFQLLPHWTGSSWQGGSKLPDAKLSWVFIRKTMMHPSKNPSLAVVRRFTVPERMTLELRGEVVHGKHQSADGVVVRIDSSRHGTLGEWRLSASKARTDIDRIECEAGDTIDFVGMNHGTITNDQFDWHVTLRPSAEAAGAASWDSARDFHGASLSRWEQLAHGLLMTNEFSYAD